MVLQSYCSGDRTTNTLLLCEETDRWHRVAVTYTRAFREEEFRRLGASVTKRGNEGEKKKRKTTVRVGVVNASSTRCGAHAKGRCSLWAVVSTDGLPGKIPPHLRWYVSDRVIPPTSP